jgi:hypothetical protein
MHIYHIEIRWTHILDRCYRYAYNKLMTNQSNVSVGAITFLIVSIGICTLVLCQGFTAMAQQGTIGNSFQMDNMTFSHLMATSLKKLPY